MIKILLSRPWPDAVVRRLRTTYEVDVWENAERMSTDDLRDAFSRYDVVCPTVTDRVERAAFEGGTLRTRLLANYGVGYEHIDLDAARAAGVAVTNTPGVLTEATADIAILLLLTASRRSGEGERQVRADIWPGWSPTHMLGQSISGKTLGLVGFGRIAQATAARAQAFGMRIAYYGRRRVGPDIEMRYDATFYPELDRLSADADVLSLHCPGGPETKHLVNAQLLNRMKPTAILINTARGSVINEADLVEALRNGAIWAAGLDVYEGEPAISDELRQLQNVVLLPHLGSATIETRTAMGMRAAENIDRYVRGEVPGDRVA